MVLYAPGLIVDRLQRAAVDRDQRFSLAEVELPVIRGETSSEHRFPPVFYGFFPAFFAVCRRYP